MTPHCPSNTFKDRSMVFTTVTWTIEVSTSLKWRTWGFPVGGPDQVHPNAGTWMRCNKRKTKRRSWGHGVLPSWPNRRRATSCCCWRSTPATRCPAPGPPARSSPPSTVPYTKQLGQLRLLKLEHCRRQKNHHGHTRLPWSMTRTEKKI